MAAIRADDERHLGAARGTPGGPKVDQHRPTEIAGETLGILSSDSRVNAGAFPNICPYTGWITTKLALTKSDSHRSVSQRLVLVEVPRQILEPTVTCDRDHTVTRTNLGGELKRTQHVRTRSSSSERPSSCARRRLNARASVHRFLSPRHSERRREAEAGSPPRSPRRGGYRLGRQIAWGSWQARVQQCTVGETLERARDPISRPPVPTAA